jgi:DNA-binding transcriptional MerR regulator
MELQQISFPFGDEPPAQPPPGDAPPDDVPPAAVTPVTPTVDSPVGSPAVEPPTLPPDPVVPESVAPDPVAPEPVAPDPAAPTLFELPAIEPVVETVIEPAVIDPVIEPAVESAAETAIAPAVIDPAMEDPAPPAPIAEAPAEAPPRPAAPPPGELFAWDPLPETSAPKPARTPAAKGTRGRKSVKELAAAADLIDIPADEILFQKQYYAIGEVAAMFKVNTSLIRYWETEFNDIKPRKNKKGDRFFTPADIKTLELIHFLLRRKKLTIEGAKEYLRAKSQDGNTKLELVRSLEKIKSFLLELKARL